MIEAVYPIVFWSVMALLVSVMIFGASYLAGHEAGTRAQKEVDAPSQRNEIALAVLLAVLPDPSVKMYGAARSQLVENCFGVADEFIKQADGRDAG